MAKVNSKAVIGKAEVSNAPLQQAAKQSVASILQSMLDSEKLRPRFEELLGKRMPSFMGSLVSMINGNPELMKAFFESPVSVMQSALKAAAYNLPIDPALGFAYVVPFNTKKKDAKGNTFWAKEAQFILGYKGMIQLANRTGAYEKLNVVDVRQGELKKFDRLTEDVEVEWIQDEVQREKLPVIGYLGYFRLVNGFEKKIYMSVNAIDAHEQKLRKGNKVRPAIWNDNYDAMACKTVLRRMISKWGLMSIDYQRADAQTIQIAQNIATGSVDDEETPVTIDTPVETPAQLPKQTGEVQQTVPEGTVQEMFMGEPVPAEEIVDF